MRSATLALTRAKEPSPRRLAPSQWGRRRDCVRSSRQRRAAGTRCMQQLWSMCRCPERGVEALHCLLRVLDLDGEPIIALVHQFDDDRLPRIGDVPEALL